MFADLTQKTTMCLMTHPAPVNYIKCGHTVMFPEQPAPVQCPQYLGTDQWHQPLADLDIGILDESGQQMPIMPEEREGQGWNGQGKS